MNGGRTCHQQCPAVSAPVEVYSFARKPKNRTFPLSNKHSGTRTAEAVRKLLYLYERISCVICTFLPQPHRAQIPGADCPAVQTHSRSAKTYSQHNLYALRCQSAQHYWYAILRTATRRRKKTRPRRAQRMELRCFKPNFLYKYDSTARQNCQVRLKIHISVTVPSYTGKERLSAPLTSPQKSLYFCRKIPRNKRARDSKFHLRYFV